MSKQKPQLPPDDFGFDEPLALGESALDWRRYLHGLARRWWLVLLCAVVATVSVGLYTRLWRPKKV